MQNSDPDYPLQTPAGRSGRAEKAKQAYGIDAVNDFDPFFEEVYDHCDAMGLDIDTLTHEGGAAQMEINFNHGDALKLADQAFLFKRTVRQTALNHDIHATFMAKPMQYQPGSSMHLHCSVIDKKQAKISLLVQMVMRHCHPFIMRLAACSILAWRDGFDGAFCE